MIHTYVNQFCKIWPNTDCPFVRGIWLILYAVFHFGFTAPTQAPMFVDLQKPLEVIYGELRNVTVLWKVCYFYSLKCFKRFISNSINSTKRMVPENVAFRSFPTVLEEQEGRCHLIVLLSLCIRP